MTNNQTKNHLTKKTTLKQDAPKLDASNNNVHLEKNAVFTIGDVVRHRNFPFRGVIFDVDAEFSNTEEWYKAIPAEIRPAREQPFYHLLAENEESYYSAYVSQQNLLADGEAGPVEHPELDDMFSAFEKGRYLPHRDSVN